MQDSSLAIPGVGSALTYASVGSRWVALVIDSLIVWALAGVLAIVTGADLQPFGPVLHAVRLLLAAIYFTVLIGRSGLTVGGRILGAKVVNENGETPSYGTAAVRWIVSEVSSLVAGLGYIWAVFDSSKQTWHDKAARTFVVQA